MFCYNTPARHATSNLHILPVQRLIYSKTVRLTFRFLNQIYFFLKSGEILLMAFDIDQYVPKRIYVNSRISEAYIKT